MNSIAKLQGAFLLKLAEDTLDPNWGAAAGALSTNQFKDYMTRTTGNKLKADVYGMPLWAARQAGGIPGGIVGGIAGSALARRLFPGSIGRGIGEGLGSRLEQALLRKNKPILGRTLNNVMSNGLSSGVLGRLAGTGAGYDVGSGITGALEGHHLSKKHNMSALGYDPKTQVANLTNQVSNQQNSMKGYQALLAQMHGQLSQPAPTKGMFEQLGQGADKGLGYLKDQFSSLMHRN